MSLFNDTIPANSEPIKLGAQRIREIKTTLNSTLGQIFSDSLSFVAGWVTGAQVANDPAIDANRAITSDHLKDGSVITRVLANGVLSADTAGRAKMADGFLTQGKLASGFTLPDGSVTASQIASGAVGASQLASGAVTLSKVAAGIAKVAIGTFSGSDTQAATISGLSFAPDFIIITGGPTIHNSWMAFRQEAPSGTGPAHEFSVSGSIASLFASAITWNLDGFLVNVHGQTGLNEAGRLHTYLALKV